MDNYHKYKKYKIKNSYLKQYGGTMDEELQNKFFEDIKNYIYLQMEYNFLRGEKQSDVISL